ncbi:hypothetical protein [Microbacterium sp. NPDC056736]|uniref:hypothetical protein n=1 Tax=Microbacterium sp. NPDC056736 TaxID=3345932 RepID=UPI00366C7A2C
MIDPDDERTAWSRRRGPAEPVDDVTVPRDGARGAASAATADAVAPAAAEPGEQPTASDAPPGPRRRGPAEPLDESTSTRLRSRGRIDAATTQTEHRGAGAAAPPQEVGGDVPAVGGRVAHGPSTAEAYRARALPAIPPRKREPQPRSPQAFVDTAGAAARERRRRRRRAVVLVAAASVCALLAVTALVALLTIG